MTNGTTEPTVPALRLARGEELIAKAIDANVPVESLERLMVLRDRLRAEDAAAAFHEALAAFQSQCPVIPKTKTVTIRPANGAPYSYSFAPLDVIVKTAGPLAGNLGLSVSFDTLLEASVMTVICTVHHTLGHAQTSTFRVPIDTSARMSEAHKQASASTYAKRYAYCNALGILSGDEDDDAAGAGGLLSTEKQAVVAPPPPRRKGTGRVAVVASEPLAVAVSVPDLVDRLAADFRSDDAASDASLEDTLRASLGGDAPLTEEERRALYGQIRLLMQGSKIAQTADNLQHAKTAIKVWLARELGVEHLEDIPQRHLARVRQEVPRLVEEAFTR